MEVHERTDSHQTAAHPDWVAAAVAEAETVVLVAEQSDDWPTAQNVPDELDELDELEALVRSTRRILIVELERHPRWQELLTLLRKWLPETGELDLVSLESPPSSQLVRALLEGSYQIRREDIVSVTPEDAAGAPENAPSEGSTTERAKVGSRVRSRVRSKVRSRVKARPDAYYVTSYQPGDEHGIIELFHRCFHPDRTLDHWRWKYELAPRGQRRISLARAANGEIVANYGAYPMALYDHRSGETVEVHQVGDIMSAPEVRGVGRGPTSLFARTARHFYAASCEGQVAFNFGVHTDNSRKFSVRFVRAHDVEPVAYRHGPLPGEVPGRTARDLLARYRIDRVSSPPSDLDELWLRAKADYRLLIRRDLRYLSWRYFSRPDREYAFYTLRSWGRLVGWLAVTVDGSKLLWGDGLVLPRHALALERVLARAGRELGASELVAWLPDRLDFMTALSARLGLSRAPEPNDLHLTVVPFEWQDAHERVSNDLFYMWGDTDLF